MKTLVYLCITVLLCVEATAQITFSVTNLPQQVGSYYRAHIGSNGNIAALLGNPGGPQQWDFSQSPAGGEIIKRMDIVSPTDGGNSASFPQATYAERWTTESSAARNWSYYSIAATAGRNYHGFVDTNSNADHPIKVFYAPTTDLPETIQLGQSWTRHVTFDDFAVFIQFVVYFTAEASVDAHGTVMLPGLGLVPALRVNEVHTYRYVDVTLGFLNYTNYYRNYYWLVPGIGKAVDVISDVSQTGPPPGNFASAGSVLRVFETSVGNHPHEPHPVGGLSVAQQSGGVWLTWQVDPNASGYRVEARTNLTTALWQIVSEPTSNSWVEAVPPTQSQRFFRVSTKP